jgi:hypothetical protein
MDSAVLYIFRQNPPAAYRNTSNFDRQNPQLRLKNRNMMMMMSCDDDDD